MTEDVKQGEIFYTTAAEGNQLRVGNQGEQIISDAHGRFYEASKNGRLFFSYNAAQTLTLAATTYTGHLIHNPTGSNVNVSILKIGVQVLVTSATMTGIVAGYNQQIVDPTGLTAATATGNCKIGTTLGAAKAYRAATLSIAGTGIIPLLHNTAAINTVGVDCFGFMDIDGAITIPPGYTFHLQALGAASAASAVASGIIYEEVPII